MLHALFYCLWAGIPLHENPVLEPIAFGPEAAMKTQEEIHHADIPLHSTSPKRQNKQPLKEHVKNVVSHQHLNGVNGTNNAVGSKKKKGSNPSDDAKELEELLSKKPSKKKQSKKKSQTS